MDNEKILDPHQVRIEFGRAYYLATIIKQNNEEFTTEQLQHIAAKICANIEANWKSLKLQVSKRFDQDMADLLAGKDYEHEL
jgi:hypothetical protein